MTGTYRLRGGHVVGCLALALALGTGVARAESPKDSEEQKRNVARGYVVEGDEALDKGDTERALERYERAERLIPAPTVRLRIARVLEKRGKLVEARDKYKQAATTDVPKDAPDVFFRAVVEAQKELAKIEPKVPTIEIARPNGAGGATIDGQPIPDDALGKPFAVNPGPHKIALPCCGAQEAVALEGARLRLVFQPAPVIVPDDPNKPPKSGLNPLFVGGLVAVGLGGVSLGVAIKGTVDVTSYNDDPAVVALRSMLAPEQNICDIAAGNAPPPPGADPGLFTQVNDRCSQAATGEILQAVFYPLGIAATVGGVVMLVLSRPAPAKPASTRLEVLPVVGAGQTGFVVRGAF
jgi:hypothetical protein